MILRVGTEGGDEDGSRRWVYGSVSRRYGGRGCRRRAYLLMYDFRMGDTFLLMARILLIVMSGNFGCTDAGGMVRRMIFSKDQQ
jgi:hypothetical protein